MNVKDYLTVEQVAKRVGLTAERVRELVHLKQIRGIKIGRWYIHPKDLDAFVKSRTNK